MAIGLLVGLGSVVGRSPPQRPGAGSRYEKFSEVCISLALNLSVEHDDDDDPAIRARDLPP